MPLTIFVRLPSTLPAAVNATYTHLSGRLSAFVQGPNLPTELSSALSVPFPSPSNFTRRNVTIGGLSILTTPPPRPVSYASRVLLLRGHAMQALAWLREC